jgi:hypothetical protein
LLVVDANVVVEALLGVTVPDPIFSVGFRDPSRRR